MLAPDSIGSLAPSGRTLLKAASIEYGMPVAPGAVIPGSFPAPAMAPAAGAPVGRPGAGFPNSGGPEGRPAGPGPAAAGGAGGPPGWIHDGRRMRSAAAPVTARIATTAQRRPRFLLH